MKLSAIICKVSYTIMLKKITMTYPLIGSGILKELYKRPQIRTILRRKDDYMDTTEEELLVQIITTRVRHQNISERTHKYGSGSFQLNVEFNKLKRKIMEEKRQETEGDKRNH
jgi:hypothetical protein